MSSPEDYVLKSDFFIAVGVLGGVCAFLLILVISMLAWNLQLAKKVKKLDPFVNFRLQRPKIYSEELPVSMSEPPKSVYDNPAFLRNPFNENQKTGSLNPIAQRSAASIDNGNFSFGNPNQQMNSFRNPDYVDRDSRFY